MGTESRTTVLRVLQPLDQLPVRLLYSDISAPVMLQYMLETHM